MELLVGNYARRWRVENIISEAVKFFNLNALSSSILVKVHFDVIMTMIADTLCTMLAQKLRGFENCDAAKIHRLFVKGKANVILKDKQNFTCHLSLERCTTRYCDVFLGIICLKAFRGWMESIWSFGSADVLATKLYRI